MRGAIAGALICLALICLSGSQALSNCDEALEGFRGVKWGSYPPYDLNLRFDYSASLTTDAENPARPLPHYAGLPVKEEWYSFNKANRLEGGLIYLSSAHIDRVIEFLRSEFGVPENFNSQKKRGYWRCANGRSNVTIQVGEWPDGTHQTITINYSTQ